MKKCVQCGQTKEDEDFRMYSPRGAGIRQTTQGRHTVCAACENLNAKINITYKKVAKSEQDSEALELAAEYYRGLAKAGNRPVGAYAKHVLGDADVQKGRQSTLLDDLRAAMQQPVVTATPDVPPTNPIEAAFQQLLQEDLVDIPDVYQQRMTDLWEKASGADQKILPQYKEVFEAAARRIDDYEDNYNWDA